MPDIIDIIMAKALTPQGQIATAAAQAQKAVRDANEAVNNIETITEQTQQNNTTAQQASTAATSALQDAMSARAQFNSMLENVTDTMDSMEFTLETATSEQAIQKNLSIVYPSTNQETLSNIVKYYTAIGNNEDGAMTQKAITDALAAINQEIEQIETSSPDMGEENNGKIVVINENGEIVPGTISQQEIINAIQDNVTPSDNVSLGLEIDYKNKSMTRMYNAAGRTMGEDFDRYPMYGGRMRCNVADNGTITAFQGDNAYTEDGSNGQVMVYQPKFYYSRVPAIVENDTIIRKEIIAISCSPQTGFTLHPLFINDNGQEVDYVLLPAYEGCAYLTSTGQYDLADSNTVNFDTDKLSSIAGAKPISGVNKSLTLENARKLAHNRGTNWKVTDLKFESAMQMLEAIEFGMLNGQSALEEGICSIPNNASRNCASITGSTSTLGNASGAALATVNETDGTYTTYTVAGKRAISYRGVENPWGNIWHLINDFQVTGNGTQRGGVPQIYNTRTSAFEQVAFTIPSVYSWISAFGYDEAHSWVFLPVECANANSALPIGDNLWTIANLNDTCVGLIGGPWHFGDNNGPFYYAFDKKLAEFGRSYSARVMYVPEKDSAYEANVTAWRNKWELI